MKFFTPDLLERFGSENDRIALAAQEELEGRSEQYADHLRKIAKKLPPRFLEVQERFYLHDARVVEPVFPWLHPEFLERFHPDLWWDWPLRVRQPEGQPGWRPSFILILQLDPPPQEFLVLHYRFARIDEVGGHPPLREEKLALLEWRHDEVELLPSDDRLEFGHSILFTHGLELRLRFRDFDYATLSPLAPLSELSGKFGTETQTR
ncbi:MAG TPA: hypothetical protein VEL76_15940 [Gemmataceae bacterium]|nr:hypothetical protein [Gemmataceae bacterium]